MIYVESYVQFQSKIFSANLKNSLVAKRTINVGTLGRPVDSCSPLATGRPYFSSTEGPIEFSGVQGHKISALYGHFVLTQSPLHVQYM